MCPNKMSKNEKMYFSFLFYAVVAGGPNSLYALLIVYSREFGYFRCSDFHNISTWFHA